MIDREKDREKLASLKDGQQVHIFWSEDGGGVVERRGPLLLLYEVPQYGNEPYYSGTYHLNDIDALLDVAYSWT